MDRVAAAATVSGHEEPEESDLHRQLFDSLRDCSRQRLRALQMTLRRNANFEGRVQSKDLAQMFQVGPACGAFVRLVAGYV